MSKKRITCAACGKEYGHMKWDGREWICRGCRGGNSRRRKWVKFEVEALGLPEGPEADVASQLADDRRIAGGDAPDYYSADADPGWYGDAASVVKRSEAYMRKVGFIQKTQKGGNFDAR